MKKLLLLLFSLIITTSIYAQSTIENKLSKREKKEIKIQLKKERREQKKQERFKNMGLNEFGVDLNATSWVQALRYHLGGKVSQNINGIPILVPVSTLGAGASSVGSSFNSVNVRQPLWVIDGVPIGDAPNGVQSLSRNIKKVKVLKHSGASKYGTRGAFGVIEIITTN
tara:strand:+ start:674 stop:1180 length:507 start_codon:yes stop_codon:yes gene_type:complete